MQTGKDSATDIAQTNLDAAMKMSAHTAEFWRRCASVQAEGANQLLEESVRMTRVILKTQSEMVDAAGRLLSAGNRAVFQNLEHATQEAAAQTQAATHQASQTGQRRAA
jgi:hypothetical protein